MAEKKMNISGVARLYSRMYAMAKEDVADYLKKLPNCTAEEHKAFESAVDFLSDESIKDNLAEVYSCIGA